VAALFWLIVRDRPSISPVPHEPALQPAVDWHAMPAPAVKPAKTFLQRLGVLARSRNMWLFGALQFGGNLGWAFLVTLFPAYLNEAFGVPLEQRGPMQSLVLVIGCCGMILGGVATDAVRAKLGPRLGRMVPIVVSLSGCAVALFLVPTLPSVWLVVAVLGVMAFLVDLHNP